MLSTLDDPADWIVVEDGVAASGVVDVVETSDGAVVERVIVIRSSGWVFSSSHSPVTSFQIILYLATILR